MLWKFLFNFFFQLINSVCYCTSISCGFWFDRILISEASYTRLQKKKTPGQKRGEGPPGPTPKSTLVVPLCTGGVAHFAVKSSRLYKSPKSQVVNCNFQRATQTIQPPPLSASILFKEMGPLIDLVTVFDAILTNRQNA